MDKTPVCGIGAPGSTPGESTIIKTRHEAGSLLLCSQASETLRLRRGVEKLLRQTMSGAKWYVQKVYRSRKQSFLKLHSKHK